MIDAVTPLQGAAVSPPTALLNQAVSGAMVYSLTAGGTGKSFTQIGGPGGGLILVDGSSGAVSYQIPTPGVFTPVVLGRDSLGGAVVLNTASINVVGALGIQGTDELPNARAGVSYSECGDGGER